MIHSKPTLYVSLLALLGLTLVLSACDLFSPPHPQPVYPSNPTPQQLQVSIWIEGNQLTFPLGDTIPIRWSVNQTANMTLSINMPNGTVVNSFSSVLYNPGTYSWNGTASSPCGQRTAVIKAVDPNGKTATDSITYTVGDPRAAC